MYRFRIGSARKDVSHSILRWFGLDCFTRWFSSVGKLEVPRHENLWPVCCDLACKILRTGHQPVLTGRSQRSNPSQPVFKAIEPYAKGCPGRRRS